MPVLGGPSATRQMRYFEKSKCLSPTTIITLIAMLLADTQQENESLTKPTPLREVRTLLRTSHVLAKNRIDRFIMHREP